MGSHVVKFLKKILKILKKIYVPAVHTHMCTHIQLTHMHGHSSYACTHVQKKSRGSLKTHVVCIFLAVSAGHLETRKLSSSKKRKGTYTKASSS